MYSPFVTSTSAQPSPVSRFFQHSDSGRDSPRTVVAEELLNFHISAPVLQEQGKRGSFTLQIPPRKLKKRIRSEDISATSPPDMDSASRRRSPRNYTPSVSPPLEEMDIDVQTPLSTPSSTRSRSPPPLDPPSDLDMDMDEVLSPADELTRYLRRKKRAEQIAAYRLRELKEEREARSLRRNKSLSPKVAKASKGCTKKVKFVA